MDVHKLACPVYAQIILITQVILQSVNHATTKCRNFHAILVERMIQFNVRNYLFTDSHNVYTYME